MDFNNHNIQNTTAGPDVSNPGNAISGGYMGESFTVKTLIIFFTGLALYNAIELAILIFFTFSRFHGLYFWSLLISSLCIIPHALGFLFKFNLITQGDSRWLAIVLITIGWYGMVTGQSVVLWSRLHLLVDRGSKGRWTLRWTKWMIVTNVIILHVPTTVLLFGSNGDIKTNIFVNGYNVMEKIQMAGFFLQESILSALYIKQASKLLKTSERTDTKNFFVQLLAINVLIILMDLGLLGAEAASLYLYEAIIKPVIYSIKLKLEFAVLGRLIQFAGGRPGDTTANHERWKRFSANAMSVNCTHDSETKVEDSGTSRNESNQSTDVLKSSYSLRKMSTNMSYISNCSISHPDEDKKRRTCNNSLRVARGISEVDVEFAQFEHHENASWPDMSCEDIEKGTSDAVKRLAAR